MRRVLISALVLLVLGTAISPANASVTVQATFTADNVTSAFFKDGGGPVDLTGSISGNLGDWQAAKTATFILASGATPHTYELLFRVNNNQLPASDLNPAGFLADLVFSGYLPPLNRVSSGLLPDTTGTWQYAIDTYQGGAIPGNLATYFSSLTWNSATEWAVGGTQANNGGNNIWTTVNSGPISGISTSANWIWGPNNGAQLAEAGNVAENYLWIRTLVPVPPVPEPATIIIWSLLGCLGISISWWRRKKAA
jgi:hypothetical protein